MTPEEKRRRHRNERIVAAIVVLLIAAATVAVIRHREALDDEVRRDRQYIPRNIERSQELDWLAQYVRFDTTNPPGNELPAAQWLAGILRQNGARAEVIESAPGRANVYARVRGRQQGTGLLLMHHIDVIGAGPYPWTKPPFAAEILMNELYGRGTLDVKAAGICYLRAFLDVAKSGRTPEHDVVFLAVADEEAGGTLGTQWLLANRPDIFEGVRYALNEGGITEMKAEKITYYGIEIGTKQNVTLRLRAATREQLQRARIALEPWFISREADRVMPEVKRWMSELAPERVEFRERLADIDRTIERGDFWSLPIGYREMAQNGVWADGVGRDEKSFTMKTLLLNLPDEDPDVRIEWLRSKVAPFGIDVEVVKKDGPVPVSPVDTKLYALLTAEARRLYDARAGTEILNRWQNDSRYLRQRGIVAYGINPYPVDYFQSLSIHGTNERIRTDFFNLGVTFARRVVAAYAFENGQ